ncbi:MAG: transcriptional regulator [Zetaproteobacteria bacterium CG02_land_8_20_14_3_00_50_9]|nr:MAG: transcriptional regulator [Zetaproteobacteria bacterium CG17_big_fil_post_rev_8_21_14_2_50_50_13]PIV30518.1 MAG: transcriptional regulator [Zetaproteobacteria bacterium CG02_land_8_20_14_3_00_50_9]PIY54749.1 MAG: transcriptional regulator [Zetaproteobacteria bacterium CG_4_10_14_0_8_um_filter_49_80]
MQFKLIVALVGDTKTEDILQAARDAGATGATVIADARGEGLRPQKTFFGLALETQRNMLLFIVEEHLSRCVLEKISEVGGFEDKPGSGVAFKIDIEDAIGFNKQISAIVEEVEDQL